MKNSLTVSVTANIIAYSTNYHILSNPCVDLRIKPLF